jgi:hypothetical protein
MARRKAGVEKSGACTESINAGPELMRLLKVVGYVYGAVVG